MTNSNFIQKVFSKHNTNILLSQELSAEAQIRVIIEDIRSEKNTHVELDTFYDGFDLYQDLYQKKLALQTQLEALTFDAPDFMSLGQEIQRIIEEENRMRINILELALTLDKIAGSTKMVEIKNAFELGQLKQIDIILPEDYLLEQFNKYLENEYQIQHVAEQLVNNANEFLVKAEITNLDYERVDRYEKAIFYLGKGKISAHVSGILHFSGYYQGKFAEFLAHHNDYDQAIPLFEEALSIFRKIAEANDSTFLPVVAILLNDLGDIYRLRNQLDLAEKLLKEALEIKEHLMQLGSRESIDFINSTLNNLGFVYLAKRDFHSAESIYQDALASAYAHTDANSTDQSWSGLAQILANKGRFHFYLKEYERGKEYLEESVQIFRRLSKTNPREHLPVLVRVLVDTANCWQAMNNYTRAIKLYEEGLSFSRDLAKSNPQAYLPDLLHALMNCGTQYKDGGDLENAQALYEEAKEICRSLIIQNPQTFLWHFAAIENNLGLVYKVSENYPKALQCYESALKIRRELATINALAYLPDLATTLYNMGSIYHTQEDFDKAQSYTQEALNVYKELSKTDQMLYQPEEAKMYHNLAEIYKSKKNNSVARVLYEKALALKTELVQKDPKAYLIDLAFTQINLSLFYLQSMPDKVLSVQFAQEAMKNVYSFGAELHSARQVMATGMFVLSEWGVDAMSFMFNLMMEMPDDEES